MEDLFRETRTPQHRVPAAVDPKPLSEIHCGPSGLGNQSPGLGRRRSMGTVPLGSRQSNSRGR